jgi:TonB family protein
MWKEWVGRTVGGKFPLRSYLGGSDHSAVFLTAQADGNDAALKLIPADSADGETQLGRWQAARALSHPNLIRILETGREGAALVYVVEECADESLSQILPERALTAEEAQGMLPPILGALQFVHDKGFVHGHIQPANILARGDEVKLASDTLARPGEGRRDANTTSAYDPPEAGTQSVAGDVWQIGMMLVEVLTRRLPDWDRSGARAPEIPAEVPAPFREIAAGCLQVEAGKRWTLGRIFEGLEPGSVRAVESAMVPAPATAPAPTRTERKIAPPVLASQPSPPNSQKPSRKLAYLVGLAAVAVLVYALIPKSKPSGPTPETQATGASSSPADESMSKNSGGAATSSQTPAKPSPATSEQSAPAHRHPAPASDQNRAASATASSGGNQGEVVRKVMPEVSPSARRTIHGTIRVRVMVSVDQAGNVTSARIESADTSRYFDRVALEAARAWKFSPASGGVPSGADQSGDRQRNLLFAFGRAKTEASVTGGKR